MAATGSSERVKDILLEHVLQDIKRLQNAQSDLTQMEDTVSLANIHVQALCEHLDRIFLHGLKSVEFGYWSLVKYFTRTEAVHLIDGLVSLKTSLGKGRAWLYLALNEQSLESYVRMIVENQDQVNLYYIREAFLKDMERVIVLQTLVAGLDYIHFDLPLDCIYLDYGATRASSTLGTLQSNNLTHDVEPSFISSVISSASKSSSQELRERSTSSPPASTTENITREKARSSSGADVFTFKRTGFTEPHDSTGKVSSGEYRSGSGLGSPALGAVGESGDSLQNSLSPHRSLSQAEAAASDHLRISVPFEGRDLGDTGDDLVQRTSKKPKSKKKKDKKRKRRESDDLTKSLPSVGMSSQGGEELSGLNKAEAELKKLGLREPQEDASSLIESWRRQDSVSSQSSRLMEEAEEPKAQVAKARRDSHRKSMEETPTAVDAEEKSHGEGETWRPAAEVLAEEERKEDRSELETLMETSPSRGLHNKRLSLGDELELAMSNEGKPEVLPGDASYMASDRSQLAPLGDGGQILSPFEEEEVEDRDLVKEQEKDDDKKLKEEQEVMVEENLGEKEVEDVSEPSYLGVEGLEQTDGGDMVEEELAAEAVVYDGSPTRPREITQEDREAYDQPIDDNTQLVVSLDVLFNEGEAEEQILRLVQLSTPTLVGQQRTCFLLLTTHAAYIMRRDGIEGQFSRDIGIRFKDFDHIVAGLGWQSLVFVYVSNGTEKRCVLLTGSEAVSRSIADSIRTTAATSSHYKQSIALTKDNEEKVEAIENELIKLGSETSVELELYLMVNWEQLEGRSITPSGSGSGNYHSGPLQVKTTNLIGITSWKPAHFVLRDGYLYQYSSDEDDVPKGEYKIRQCGGCQRVSNEGKQYAFSVISSDGSVMVVAAASDEGDMTKWIQVLIETAVMSPTHKTTCFSCALLLTQDMIHILQEDWSNQSVQLVASCRVTDVNDISVDKSLPLYCTISYDQESDQGMWLVCFNTQYELGKLEMALGKMWKDEFQVDLKFSEVDDTRTQERAHKAVEQMQVSRYRCDSVTRGRTEFTYSDKY